MSLYQTLIPDRDVGTPFPRLSTDSFTDGEPTMNAYVIVGSIPVLGALPATLPDQTLFPSKLILNFGTTAAGLCSSLSSWMIWTHAVRIELSNLAEILGFPSPVNFPTQHDGIGP
jgi:hypothetical protein